MFDYNSITLITIILSLLIFIIVMWLSKLLHSTITQVIGISEGLCRGEISKKGR